MKYKYHFWAVLMISIFITACQKSGNSYPVVGKWQETKLRMYAINGSVYVYDTTFYHPFTDSDFIAFKDNGTCTICNDYYYYSTKEGYSIPYQKIPAQFTTLNYIQAGSKYVLTTQGNFINPGGFTTTDTVMTPDAHTLLLHAVSYGPTGGVASVYDSYYTK